MQPGDLVRVSTNAKVNTTDKFGWDPQMDDMIGEEYKIINTYTNLRGNGFILAPNGEAWVFSEDSLELVDHKPLLKHRVGVR